MSNIKFQFPSDLFKWFMNHDKRKDEWNYKSLFNQYFRYKKTDHYLWETYDRRLYPIIDIVKKSKKIKILEVGFGFWHDLLWASQFGHEVYGIDVKSIFFEICCNSQRQLEKAINKKLNVNIFNINLLDLDENNKFDLIFMKDTFHHLEPREEVTSKISKLLNKNGKVIIIEPNALNPLIQLQMFKIRGFNTVILKQDPNTGKKFIYGNERLITGKKINRIFKIHNIKSEYYNIRFLPTFLVKYNILVKIVKKFEINFFEKIFQIFCVHTIFIGKKNG